MLGKIVRMSMLASALALTTLPLSACGPQPVVSSAPACAAWKPIDAVANSDDIMLVFAQNMHTMRPLTDEINANNKERARFCR